MLVAMHIRNLAVIETIQLQFHQGFHAFTGETGAGKSIIIDALALIAGARGSASLIRYGCERAEVEASFDLSSNHPIWNILLQLGIQASSNEWLIIRRELLAHGKSLCRVNGQMVTVTMLREMGEQLITIHGQHEQQSLLKVERHLQWLDTYGGKEMERLKQEYETHYRRFQALQTEWKQLHHTCQQTDQRLDLYRFQREELRTAQLTIGEDELLIEEKRKLSHVDQLMHDITASYEHVYCTGALEFISKASSMLEQIQAYDEARLQPIKEQIQTAYYQLEDAAYQLRDYKEQLEYNPERLQQIEERLHQIMSLKRKYGSSVESMVEYLQKIEQEINQLEHKDEHILQLESHINEQLRKLIAQAQSLTEARCQFITGLTKQMEAELHHLHMERTRFDVRLQRLETKQSQGYEVEGRNVHLNSNGWDKVEFLISPNLGEPLQPLHKITSGGELSRMMLALTTIFATVNHMPALIFDEVDTGVSGRAAQAIAQKLAQVAHSGQVFVITHLPQVACMADHHYYIEKHVHDERTKTQVTYLQETERIAELARMLSGVEVTERTLHHAQEMLTLAQQQKGCK